MCACRAWWERQMMEGEGSFKTEYSLLRTTRESIDDDGRQHQYESLTLTLTPEAGDAMELTALAHFHSLSANRNPTTLELDASWKQGDMTLTLQGEFKTTSPWVLQVIDETGAQDVATLSKQELEAVLADYAAGGLALIQQMGGGNAHGPCNLLGRKRRSPWNRRRRPPQPPEVAEETTQTPDPDTTSSALPLVEQESTASPTPGTSAAAENEE